ncbi:MAG TPA: hypothetical protein VHX37_05125 [Acidobacteriaceae bacterium]|jgi:hypothetical protein|nr:hypothetical protein [Acidobacteriaceae bacterium]
MKGRVSQGLAVLVLAAGVLTGTHHVLGQEAGARETIIAIRHAEKPPAGLGQLDCQGLNRALALPRVMSRFGRPDAIFAPDPAQVVNDRSNQSYSYLRPLVTIEPTAIALGMPVDAQIGFRDIAKLQAAVTAPTYANARIFIAWEHLKLNDFAKLMLASYGDNPAAVPDWPNDDYDRIYIFTITQETGKPKLSFKIEHEGLDGKLSDRCPGVAQ